MANGADRAGNFHDERGQFVSITTLFERERGEHAKDHDREREISNETARRLERGVDEAARRLERMVEETANRLEKGVETALRAVAGTAAVHADAHSKEHLAHERIHAVEKDQVGDAKQTVNRRLDEMNEFRGALEDQSARAVSRELFDATLAPLVEFRARALGFGALIALVSGAIGAVVTKAIGG